MRSCARRDEFAKLFKGWMGVKELPPGSKALPSRTGAAKGSREGYGSTGSAEEARGVVMLEQQGTALTN